MIAHTHSRRCHPERSEGSASCFALSPPRTLPVILKPSDEDG